MKLATKAERAMGVTLIALTLVLICNAGAWALMVPRSFNELVNEADQIVQGRVESVQSFMDLDLIKTRVTIAPERTLAGEARSSYSFELLGGELFDSGLWIEDSPSFQPGERVIVFLRDDSVSPLVGRVQGKVQVRDGLVVEYGVSLERFDAAIRSALAGNAVSNMPRPELHPVAPPDPCDRLDLPEKACHYEYDGTHWSKQNPTTETFRVNENGPVSGEADEITTAANTWSLSASGANWDLNYSGSTGATDFGANYSNEVFFANVDEGAIGLTAVWYNPQSGLITECDMALNLDYSWSSHCAAGDFDVQTIALHEFGHFLMLGDMYDDTYDDHVMYGYGWEGECSHDLACGDRNGVQYIYGTYGGGDDDDDDTGDDDSDDDDDTDCDVVCERIDTCLLGDDLGLETMNQCLELCADFRDSVVQCILDAYTCGDVADCIGVDDDGTRSEDSSNDACCGI